MKRRKGRVLWFDAAEGYGIIKDFDGNEYYVERSGTKRALVMGESVTFEVRPHTVQIYMAHNVECVEPYD